MTSWENEMEEKWGRALVHESGHALMAVLQDIPCNGICFKKDVAKFCAVAVLPPPENFSRGHFLFHVASSAAELVTYGNQNEDGAKSDRLPFANPGAPPLEETISEARGILLGKRRQLKRLVSKLKAKLRGADYDVGRLPETIGMEGSDAKFAVLLSKEELEDAVRRS